MHGRYQTLALTGSTNVQETFELCGADFEFSVFSVEGLMTRRLDKKISM